MSDDEGERRRGGQPRPTRSEPDPVSVPENGDFRYDQANEAQDEPGNDVNTRHYREA